MYTGSCLCGAVTFDVTGELGRADACHCVQCRKWTGHFLASTEVSRTALSIRNREHLGWHQSSEKVRRGFCRQCGSPLFFDPVDTAKHGWIGISLGAIDGASNTRLERHIFVAEKGDYYDIGDGLPQNEY